MSLEIAVLKYLNGSILSRLHVATMLARIAAVFPPLSLMADIQFFRPTAIGLSAFSAKLIVNRQVAVFNIYLQRLPVFHCVIDCFPKRTLRKDH